MPPLLTGPSEPEATTHLVCTFWLGSQLFGIDVTDVKEVNLETACTRIPHTPGAVLGYINLRGQIFLVLDLRQMLGLSPSLTGPNNRLVILQARCGDRLAVLVDQIGEIIPVSANLVEPVVGSETSDPNLPGIGSELLIGVARLEKHLLHLLRARQFQKAIQQMIKG